MKYPEWNAERLDTGIRKTSIVRCYGKDIAKHNGEAFVYVNNPVYRRADAATNERDITVDKIDGAQIAFSGSVADCISFLATWVPAGPELYRDENWVYWVDPKVEAEYKAAIAKLCDDGAALAAHLNERYKHR